jgi:hypothetical protein
LKIENVLTPCPLSKLERGVRTTKAIRAVNKVACPLVRRK